MTTEIANSQLPTPKEARSWRVVLPSVVLVAVALAQLVLAYRADLSPWKGGGFGMFSTLDAPGFRDVRVVVRAPGRSETLTIAPSQEELATRAVTLPTDARLWKLAEAVEARERRYGRPVTFVGLDVVGRDVDAVTLAVTERPIRHVDYGFGTTR